MEPRRAGCVLHPEGEAGADAAAAVRRVHGRVAAVAAGDLGVADEPLLASDGVEDADGLGGDVEAGPTQSPTMSASSISIMPMSSISAAAITS